MVANTDLRVRPELPARPGPPAFTALANSDVRYWRVRVTDDSGLVSDWSDAAQFERQSKGTLTLTNPAVSPSNYVDEVTPPISWTFTGRTQERAKVWVYEIPEAVYDESAAWEDQVDTEVSINVEQGVLKTGGTYEVKLRVWDTVDREGRPGDQRYEQVTREFTYQRSGVPPAVTSLTATASGPAVSLVWSRATQPDFFSLRIDDREIEERIDPTDVFTSGTSYAMDVYRGDPGTTHTFEIEAVVNAKHSDGNAIDHRRLGEAGDLARRRRGHHRPARGRDQGPRRARDDDPRDLRDLLPARPAPAGAGSPIRSAATRARSPGCSSTRPSATGRSGSRAARAPAGSAG